MTAKELLIYLAVRYQGDWTSIYNHISQRLDVSKDDVKKANQELSCDAVTIIDEEKYPKILLHCPRPPFVLFYRGNINLIQEEERCVSVIGSRGATEYGLKMAKEIAGGLAKKGYVVVSGLAKGIDGAALEAAVPYGKAVAVLGNGLAHTYPSCHRALQERIARDGLLISEYPSFVTPNAENFPARNRIIAYLSHMCVVAGAKRHSGTQITVAFAAEAGKDVGAVPYRADEENSCNRLIQDGAALITSAEDVIFQLEGARDCQREKGNG